MLSLSTARDWSEETFSQCDLGDKRRTNRLIKLAHHLSSKIGSSVAKACEGDSACVEASYRLIRNEHVKSIDIAEGGFQSTVKKSKESSLLLALEDTTSFNYTHQAEGLEDLTGNNGNARGFYAHSVLLVAPLEEKTLGLIEQIRWQRKISQRGQRYNLKNRSYEEKESFKWEQASEAMSKRLEDKMSDVISVCDREADVYDYLLYKKERKHRFIVRAVRDRCLSGGAELISDAINESPVLGRYTVSVAQKSGRKARKATLELRSSKVLLEGVKRDGYALEDLELNVVSAIEIDEKTSNVEKLSWVIITSESVDNFESARDVIRYYEMRWRIEEFHKAWKTGAGAERQRMQSADNLEKMVVILGFVAVRLLQLREALETNNSTKLNLKCTEVLTENEFIILWFTTLPKSAKKRKPPKKIPGIQWAYKAIAKLGGWGDTKRTGKASWLTIWEGWFRLRERTEGYEMTKFMA